MKPGKFTPLFLALSLFFGPFNSQKVEAAETPPQAAQSAEEGASAKARFLTAVNIPARGGLCVVNTFFASVVTLVSAGTRYGDASEAVEESCSGPWVITDRMIAESQRPKPEEPDNWSGLGLP